MDIESLPAIDHVLQHFYTYHVCDAFCRGDWHEFGPIVMPDVSFMELRTYCQAVHHLEVRECKRTTEWMDHWRQESRIFPLPQERLISPLPADVPSWILSGRFVS